MRPLDLISVGRCMVDLYCDQVGAPVSEGQSLSMYIGGCPTNVAVGSRRQGLRVAMLTRVGTDATGEFVVRTFQREGVDTSHIRPDPTRITPMVVAGIEPPGHFPLTWYREKTADLAVTAEDFDDAFIGSAQAVLISGNSLSTPESEAMVKALVETARRTGTRIVYDIDWRPVLWNMLNPNRTAGEISAILQSILPSVDLLVGTEEEYQALMNLPSAELAFKTARSRIPGVAVMKLGKLGALVAEAGQAPVHHPGFPVEVYNTLGAGDAFLSGFLAAWLRDRDLTACARQANASGAMVVTRHGCAPAMPYESEIEHFLTRTVPAGTPPRDDEHLNRLHAQGAQPPLPAPLLLVAIDDWIRTVCGPDREEQGQAFRRMVVDSLPETASYIVDTRTPRPWQMDLTQTAPLVLETLSQPQSYPMALQGTDPALALRERPRRLGVRTVLPVGAEESDIVERWHATLLSQLGAATSAWDRLWLLQLSGHGQSGSAWVEAALAALTARNISPRLWALPWPENPAELTAWAEVLRPLLAGRIVLQAPPALEVPLPAEPLLAGVMVGEAQLGPALAVWLGGMGEAQVEKLIRDTIEPIASWLWRPDSKGVAAR